MPRQFGKLRRGALVAYCVFLSQTLLIFVAMVVVHCGRVNGNLDTITDHIDLDTIIPVALLSFQSVGQTVGSRALNLSGVPTVVLTSMLHDIFADHKLVAKDNVKRDPRILALFAIPIGAIGVACRHRCRWQGS